MRIWICLLLGYCFLLGCNSKEREYRKIVEYWEGKEIVFPDLTAKYFGNDTLCPDLWNKPYKILHYVDTLGCTSCKLHLFEWRQYILELEKLSPEVSCLFVLGIPDFSEFEQQQVVNRFEWPVFYDSKLKLDSLNHLPTNPIFQTFLLDSNNRVIAIGDPLQNKGVCELYRKIITGQLK